MKPIEAKYNDFKYIITHNIRICERVCRKTKETWKHVDTYSVLLKIFNSPNYLNELGTKMTHRIMLSNDTF